jgi:hypothetical protein
MSHKNSDFQRSWNLHISVLEPEPLSLFWLHTSIDVASDRPASWSADSTSLFLAKNCVWRVCFCSSWSLTSVKSMWFKTFIGESIVRFKILDNQCWNLNWKIRSVRDWKCSGNIYSPSGYQYRICTRIFTKVTRKCECFCPNIEPCETFDTTNWLQSLKCTR